MDKKFIKNVVAVLLALCVFTMIGAAVSLVFEAILAKDLNIVTNPDSEMKKAISYMSNGAIALACLLVPALVCFALSYFSKQKKVFCIISALMSLFLAATCLGFFFDLRSVGLKEFGLSEFTACAEFFTSLISLATASAVCCAYFTASAVCAFKKHDGSPAENAEEKQTAVAEEESHEEV